MQQALSAAPTHPVIVQMYSGKMVDLTDFKPADVSMVDIAHHLSIVNRFNGATKHPLSVAQHSVQVARLLQAERYGRELVAQALMHDAAEAYMGDIRSPLKNHPGLSWLRQLEETILTVILTRFNLPTVLDKLVIKADLQMLAVERDQLLRQAVWPWNPPYPAPDVILPKKVHMSARQEFLFLAQDLGLEIIKLRFTTGMV